MNNRLWKFLTSLKVTVALLVLSTLLVFLGTLAQVHEGLWAAQERWFKSYLVFRRAGDVWWVPWVFPGGYTLGFGLLINLVAAHIKRFQFTWKKVGIHLTHAGIVLLLIGQLATDMLSRESFISFEEGQTRAHSEAHRAVEFVILGEPGSDGREKVISFTEEALRRKIPLKTGDLPFELKVTEFGENCEVFSLSALQTGVTRLQTALAKMEGEFGSAEGLPVEAARVAENPGREIIWRAALKAVGEKDKDIVAAATRVAADPERAKKLREDLKHRFRTQMLAEFRRIPRMQMANETVQAMKFAAGEVEAGRSLDPNGYKPATEHGMGARTFLVPKGEARGMDERNFPYAKVEALEQGKSLGVWLVTPWLNSQELQVGERKFRIALRGERYPQPFTLTLLKTTHDVYTGTDIPKNFQSRVLLENPEKNEKREVDISMNNPLRYGGLTFYQHQMGRTEVAGGKGNSTLQVVRNPSWITPYLGCAIVALGMVWQFLYHLSGFLSKPRPSQPAPPASQN